MNKSNIIILVALILPLALASASAHAKARARDTSSKLRRPWQIPANQSYLKVLENSAAAEEALKLLSQREAGEVKREYLLMTREHENRKHHNLNRSADDRSYFERLKNFTSSVVRKMARATLARTTKKAEKASSVATSAVQAVQQVQNVVQGATEVAVEENLKIGTHADILEKRGQLWMQSTLVDGAVDVNFSSPNEVNLQSTDRQDRYRFSVARALPLLELRSGVSYGVQTTRMTASVSRTLREIAPTLTAEYSRTQGLDAARSGYAEGRGEDAVRFSYGINF